MKLHRRTVLMAVVTLGLSGVVNAQSKDSFVGTWVLNRARSDFDPPSPFRQRTLVIAQAENGLSFATKTVSDRLQASETSYVGPTDGSDIPFKGSAIETVSLRRVNPTTIERIGKVGGKEVEQVTMKVSADGKTLTLTQKGTAEGRSYQSTQVFERQ